MIEIFQGVKIYLSLCSKLQGALLQYYKDTINNRDQTYILLLFYIAINTQIVYKQI